MEVLVDPEFEFLSLYNEMLPSMEMNNFEGKWEWMWNKAAVTSFKVLILHSVILRRKGKKPWKSEKTVHGKCVNKIQKHVRKLQFIKGNCKVVLVHAMKAHKAGAEVYLHSALTLALDAGELMI